MDPYWRNSKSQKSEKVNKIKKNKKQIGDQKSTKFKNDIKKRKIAINYKLKVVKNNYCLIYK